MIKYLKKYGYAAVQQKNYLEVILAQKLHIDPKIATCFCFKINQWHSDMFKETFYMEQRARFWWGFIQEMGLGQIYGQRKTGRI